MENLSNHAELICNYLINSSVLLGCCAVWWQVRKACSPQATMCLNFVPRSRSGNEQHKSRDWPREISWRAGSSAERQRCRLEALVAVFDWGPRVLSSGSLGPEVIDLFGQDLKLWPEWIGIGSRCGTTVVYLFSEWLPCPGSFKCIMFASDYFVYANAMKWILRGTWRNVVSWFYLY